jgi:transposase-like protein
MGPRRKFSKEFKLTAIRRLESGQSPAEVARALEVNPSELYRWRRELDKYGERAFAGLGNRRTEEGRVAELERKIGQQTLEIDFLKRALQHVEEQRLLRALSNGAPSTSRSKKK